MKKAIRATVPVIAVFLILAMTMPVSASWDSDLGNGTAVTIGSKDPFTVDTFLGVPSYYSEKSSKYTDSELVTRFYRDAYSLSVSASGTPSISTEGYEFKIPETPQQGDIVCGSGHWAIVKSYSKSKGTITIFEQGNASDGKAYKDRTLKYPSDSYTVYTPRAKSGYSSPVLMNLDTNSKVSISKGKVSDVTEAEETTKASTTKASDKKTTSASEKTTGSSETTTEYNYTTYVGENEAEVVEDTTYTTSPMPEGYEEFFTSSTESQDEGETGDDGAYDPNADTQDDYYDTQAYGGNVYQSTTEPVTEKDKSISPTLIFGLAMIGGIVCITGAGVFAGLVLKKRSEDDD